MQYAQYWPQKILRHAREPLYAYCESHIASCSHTHDIQVVITN